MQETKKRAAIYIRCSSDEAKKAKGGSLKIEEEKEFTTKGYSPETQEEKLRSFIKENKWQLNERHIYKDIGHSGGTDKRPDLQRLLKDAKNREFDIILVYRQDRFFRNLRLLLNTVGDLRELGIEFKSLTEPFDTTTPTGRAMFGNAGVFAEWQREIGLEARNEGMIKAMKEGKWLGGTASYGLKFNQKTQKPGINQREVEIVRMMFEWLVSEKLSKYKIQQRLNERKIPTKFDNLRRKKKVNGRGWWNARTVERILKNEIYTGEFYYRKYKYLGGTRKELRPKEEWIKIKVPPIISRELFERAQEQLRVNQKLSPRRTKNVYIFQHKLHCGLDGFPYHSMCRAPQKPQWNEAKVYFCGGRIKHSHSQLCPSKYIAESRLLPTVWENLRNLLTNPELIINDLQEYRNQDSKRKSIEEEMGRLGGALMTCQRKKEKILNLYSEEYIDESICKKRLDTIKKEELCRQKEMEKLSQFLLTEQERENRILSVQELHGRLKNSIDSATYEIKRQVIQKLVEKIIVTGDLLEMEYNLPLKEALQGGNGLIPALEFCGDNRRMDGTEKRLGDSG